MSEGLRVLVIDDDDAVREVACRGLEAEGYRVAAAASGPAGLALVTAEPFDAIVSDIRMPGLSGLELLAEIRRTQPDAVVVLMTGYADFEMVLTALRAGADDFVVKPVNFRALAAVVRRAIDRRELRADLAALRRQAHLTDRFLAFVSHKLNTPLTGLLLFLEALADEGGVERRLALLDAGLPDALAAAGRLRDLIDALLRFAQAAAAAPPAGGAGGGVPLLPLLEEVAAVGGRAAPRGVRVRVEAGAAAGAVVRGSREGLSRAFHELLDNAVKFSPDGGEVRIEAGWAAARGMVEVRVVDAGPGIPEADRARVLEPFQQVDPAFTGQLPGFGLGLALVRCLVEGIGGRVALEAGPGGVGTAATVWLPQA